MTMDDVNTPPGDELVPAANMIFDHRTIIVATPEDIWPWLIQLGKRRAGWYLPAHLERLLPAGSCSHPPSPDAPSSSRLRFRGHVRSTGLKRHVIIAVGGFFDRLTGQLMIKGLQQRLWVFAGVGSTIFPVHAARLRAGAPSTDRSV